MIKHTHHVADPNPNTTALAVFVALVVASQGQGDPKVLATTAFNHAESFHEAMGERKMK